MIDMFYVCESSVDLMSQIDEAWDCLAQAVFDPNLLFYSMEEMVKNPLAVAVTSALLVVVGFKIFSKALSIFNSKY